MPLRRHKASGWYTVIIAATSSNIGNGGTGSPGVYQDDKFKIEYSAILAENLKKAYRD